MLWLGCANGVLGRYDGRRNDFVYYTSGKVVRTANTIETICEDREKCLPADRYLANRLAQVQYP